VLCDSDMALAYFLLRYVNLNTAVAMAEVGSRLFYVLNALFYVLSTHSTLFPSADATALVCLSELQTYWLLPMRPQMLIVS
jgi:hypothetical protein